MAGYDAKTGEQKMSFNWNAPRHLDGNACVHPDDMKAWEAAEIQRCPEAGYGMMEIAGREVAMAVLRYAPSTVLIFCGTGNNGGDGLVAAHYLRHAGCTIHLFGFDGEFSKSPDAKKMFARVQDLPRTILRTISDVSVIPTWKDHRDLVVVDAIFGTGYRPSHNPLMTRVYQCIEELNCPILSVDIASGIDASTGFRGALEDATPPRALKATETITFGAPKIGHFCGDGPQHTGELRCVDIGLGPWCGKGLRRTILSDAYVAQTWPFQRSVDVHKGKCGHVFVVGGSIEMPGAANLAARAALRSGAGLVTVASPASGNTPDEIMRCLLTQSDVLDESKIEAVVTKADAILAGPGLGRTTMTVDLIRQLAKYAKTLVLDADALWALCELEGSVQFASRDLFLTPHIGEAARLLNCTTTEVMRDLGKAARSLAMKYKATVILKSHVTHIATPKPTLALLPYPNGAMASAGIGDVLAGMVVAIAAQSRGGALVHWLDSLGIAAVAVNAHSRAGREVAKTQSTLIASDIIAKIQL